MFVSVTTITCVNGDWPCQLEIAIFDPLPHITFNRSPKYLLEVITSSAHGATFVATFGANPPIGASEQMGEINENFIYLCIPFSGTHLHVRPVNGFSRLMAQTTRIRARMCLLWVSLILLPILGVESPKTPIWGA